MQLFGDEGKEDKNKVNVGNNEVKIVKAASLPEGTHPVRFYPLSPEFSQGADYISIVQHVHWLSRQPIICRRTSYDYENTPDTQPKPHIDTHDVICSDSFAWYKKGNALKETDPQESVRLRAIGKDLMAKVMASSIVSLTDVNGNLAFPVILRYGKELLDQLQLHAYRIHQNSGVHICDPAVGYMFDIIVGKNDGGFRTYKNSMPSVDTSPVDITQAPWKWNEICEAIRSEIMPIPTPDEVHSFYLANYGGSQNQQQTFHHPAFQENNNAGNAGDVGDTGAVNSADQNFVPPDTNQNKTSFTPPATNQNDGVGFAAPKVEGAVKTTAPVETKPASSFSPPAAEKTVEATKTVIAKPAAKKLYPCNSLNPGGSGYEKGDATCKSCPQAKECYENSTSLKTNGKPAEETAAVSTSANNSESFNTGNVQERLNVLNNKIKNNG